MVIVRVSAFVLFAFAACSCLFGAGFGEIRGVVTSERGERLKGAQVAIQALKLGGVTSAHGHYVISGIPDGEHGVTVRMTGYESRSMVVTIAAGETVNLDFILKSGLIDLPPVVVTATMTIKGVDQIPAAVEVVEKSDMRAMGAETAADALGESRSLVMQSSTGRAMTASIRGLRNNHCLVLIDGRRLSAGFRDNIDLGDIPTGNIERIEIVRGPTSALYGSDAIGGVINIITRKPTEKTIGGFGLRYGQNRYGEAENPVFKGDISRQTGRIGYAFSGSFNLNRRYDRDKGTLETDGDQKHIGAGSGQLTFNLAPTQQLLFGTDYLETGKEGNRAYGWGSGKRTEEARRKSLMAEYRGKVSKYSELVIKEYYSSFRTDIEVSPLSSGNWFNPLTGTEDAYHLDQELNQLELRWSGLLHADHLATAGLEHRYEKRKDNAFNNDVGNSAIFFQDEYQVSDQFLLIFGSRYDRHSVFGSAFSPKINLFYAIHDNLRLNVSYGKGFRAPNIFELYIETDTRANLVRPNPDLDCETSRSFELGLEGGHGMLSGGIRFFRNDLRDMITTVQVGTDTIKGKNPVIRPVFEYGNTGKAMTQGLEIDVSISLPGGIVVSDDATIMSTRNKTTGYRLFNEPDLINNWKVGYSNSRLGLKANLRANTTGGRRVSENYETKGFTLWNLHVSRELSRYSETYIGINNLFNADPDVYGFAEGARVAGTFFYAGISFEFR